MVRYKFDSYGIGREVSRVEVICRERFGREQVEARCSWQGLHANWPFDGRGI